MTHNSDNIGNYDTTSTKGISLKIIIP